MRYLLSELKERILTSPREFIAECEEQYRKRVGVAADMIMENMSICPVVLLSGPSGSGKTTTAKRIEEELERRGINTHTVSMDNYFSTLDLDTCPRTPEGEVDFESPQLMDMDLLNEHFDALSHGKEIKIPYYMFARQKRSTSQYTKMQLKENEIAIFEGIHALNNMITDKNPGAFGLYISPQTEVELPDGTVFLPRMTRLARRVVRDNNFRGADAKYTLKLWKNVIRGESEHIYPFVDKASLRLDSSLDYELSILGKYVLPMVEGMDDTVPGYEYVKEMMPLLKLLPSTDDEYVPVDSLLREFIGGGRFEY